MPSATLLDDGLAVSPSATHAELKKYGAGREFASRTGLVKRSSSYTYGNATLSEFSIDKYD